ncbi:MAG: YfiR family protein [Verrucomicrobia bacterium]|nr:MAG: YfiR family protein [Verrucomicrobiota bacterium]
MKAPHLHLASFLRACVMGAALLTAFAFSGNDASAQSYEKIRAIFLYNFAKHVEWPDTAFSDAKAPIVIGVVDASKVAKELERSVRGKDANGHDIAVKEVSSPADADGCHIVYIPDKAKAPAFIEAFQGKPILTVGEQSNFTEIGGMIKLFEKTTRSAVSSTSPLRPTPDSR